MSEVGLVAAVGTIVAAGITALGVILGRVHREVKSPNGLRTGEMIAGVYEAVTENTRRIDRLSERFINHVEDDLRHHGRRAADG